MMRGIKNIIFDLGGVLMDLDKQACIDAFKKLGYQGIEDLLGSYAQKGTFLELEKGLITPDEFRRRMRKEVGKPLTDPQIDDAFCTFLVDIPNYKLDMLRRLKSKYRILMLSNTNSIMMEVMLDGVFRKQGLDVYAYFDKLYLSYQMGEAKPDAKIYEMLIADSGIQPDETFFLDDSAANIAVGGAFGFKTHLTAPHEDFRQLLEEI